MPLQQIMVPDIGDAHDVDVVEILVARGATVDIEQSLIVVESDKASMEIPSPARGVVRQLAVTVGDKVSEGTAILVLDVVEEEAKTETAPETTPETGTGTGTETETETAPGTETETPMVAAPAQPGTPGLPVASPSVRKLARTLGVELAEVEGSGERGRVQRQDLELHVKQRMQRARSAPPPGLSLPASTPVDFSQFGEVTREPLTKIQRRAGENLHRSWLTIPLVTQHDSADITELEAFRKQLKRDHPEAKITLLCFFIKALARVLRHMPRFNASLDVDGEHLVLKRYVHIGVAVDTPAGLVVPVVRDADRKGLLEIAAALTELSERARGRKLTPGDMQGACMTVSSLGGIGGTAFTPLINPPEVAILGVSRAQMAPVFSDGAFVPRLMCPLSLSYDHRVIDGADAARFTSALGTLLGDIRQLLL